MAASGQCGSSRSAALGRVFRTLIFDSREAHSIGMTRSLTASFPNRRLVSSLPFAAALLLFAVALALPACAHAQSAATWNKRGQAAELRQNYDTAYEDYLHAHQKAPKDMRYETRVDRMRFQAAAQHVDRGRVLRQSGDLMGALNEFTRALQIDPGNETAAQEIQVTQHPQTYPQSGVQPPGVPGAPAAVPNAGAAIPPPAASDASQVLREIGSVSAPVVLKPLSNDPITLHIVEDAKVIYQSIGKAAGLNVLFDPDFPSKRIPVDLNSVSYLDALRIVGLVSGSFFKPVTSDTIFVAQNNQAKHTDFDDLAVQTFYLTNVSQPNDGNEIQTAVRNLLPPDIKLNFVASQNALILRGTTDELMLAEKLLNDLDRPKAEVVIDIAILEVNRDKIRTLGITLPQSFGLTPQASSNTITSTTTTTTTTGTTTTPSAFTLNTLGNLNATNFAVTLTGGTLNALLSDADTRVLQNPSVRATDGQRGTLKIGSRIPIATGSYSAGAATGITAGIGVQTQFQYIDVGVNIDLTPIVHLDREVSLKEKIEVTSETSQVTISSVTEPVLSQRTSEGNIQLKDGEPCLLAGILNKEDNSTNSGTPGLAEIPLIKYLFGTQNHEVMQDEIVFILVPHIVRESLLTRQNIRAIDTGTSHGIELRTDPAALLVPELLNTPPSATTSTTAATAAAAMIQPIAQAANPPTPPAPPALPPAAPRPGANLSAAPAGNPAGVPAANLPATQPVTLTVLPVDSSQAVGSTFQVAVQAANVHDLYSVPMQLQFDPKVLQLVNVDAGALLASDGQNVALVHRDDGAGLVTISTSRPPGATGVSGQGSICTLTFKAIAAGDSKVALVKVGATSSKLTSLPAVGSQAVVHVK
jgi:general secretion pathway protein D